MIYILVFFIILVIISIISLLPYFYKAYSSKYIETEGPVFEYSERYNKNGTKRFAEKIEFDVDGKKYICMSEIYTSHPKNINSVLKVKYNPNNPNDNVIKNSIRRFIILFALIILLIGLVYATKDRIEHEKNRKVFLIEQNIKGAN